MIHPSRPLSLRRLVAVLTVSATTLGLASAGTTATADETTEIGARLGATSWHLEPLPIDRLCENVPTDFRPFGDIAGHTFEREINCLAYGEVALGNDGTYTPGASINREQMASLLARLIDKAVEHELEPGLLVPLPEWDGVDNFVDTDPSSPHTGNVNRLRAAGISLGGPDGLPADQYGPGRLVSRGQMATFVVRALGHLLNAELVYAFDHFTDDAGTTHEANINLVAEAGIAVGRPGSTLFGLQETLPRGQMAAFIARSLSWLELIPYETDEEILDGVIWSLPTRP